MNAPAERPPYRAALAVGAAVLAVYVLTLAPTVTFWDAGEFIAAARTLGIPHPPGTPLFVLIAHAWGMLVPIGEWAYRTNLLSALLQRVGGGTVLPGGAPIHARRGRGASRETPRGCCGSAGPRRPRCSARSASPTGRTPTRPRSIRSRPSPPRPWRGPRCCGGAGGSTRARPAPAAPDRLPGGHLDREPSARTARGARACCSFWRPRCATSRRPIRLAAAPSGDRWRSLAGVWALLVGIGLGSAALTALGAACFLGRGAVRRDARCRKLRGGGAADRGRGGHALRVHLSPLGPEPDHQRGGALDPRRAARGDAPRAVSAPDAAGRSHGAARARQSRRARSR